MKRPVGMGLVVLVFLVLGSLPRMVVADQGSPREVPRSATVEILLLKAPGLNVTGSKWEIAYEFRITNEASLWTEREKFKGTSEERVGDLLKQATVKNSLESPKGQKLIFEIPFTAETLERLRNQPKDRIHMTAATMTPENIKLNEEQELKCQIFLFYSVISVYDAKLKKTLTMPVSRIWDFAIFPEARFEVKIEINDNGSYNVNSSWPKKTRS
jgi:hypothetical protein